MRVLITGGTGYLGRAVVRAIAAHRHDPVVFARHATTSGLPGVLVDGDVRDRAAIQRAAASCDAVCHMAALVSIWRRRAQDFDDVNVGGLRHVIDVVRASGIPRVLYTSSFLALPPAGRSTPIQANDYQRTKVAADGMAEIAGRDDVPLIRLYPGVVYGPGRLTEGNLVGRLIDDHRKGRLPGLVGPEHMWSYSFVNDVATAHCAALERGRIGVRYILGGENATQQQMFSIIRQITGRPVPPRIPYALASAIGALEECRVRVLGGLPLLTRGAVEIFRHDWPLDSDVAFRELGYRITPLADGLRQTLEAIDSGSP